MTKNESGFSMLFDGPMSAMINGNFTKREYRMLLFMISKIWRYGKEADKISCSQFTEGTGLSRRHAWNTRNSLLAKNVIYIVPDSNRKPKTALTYGINKNFLEWEQNKDKNDHKLMPKVADLIEDLKEGERVAFDDYGKPHIKHSAGELEPEDAPF